MTDLYQFIQKGDPVPEWPYPIRYNEVNEISGLVSKILTDPASAWLFDHEWEVRNEAEVITAQGEIFRPDRLMFKGREMVIVDFKTGKESNRHFNQVNQYSGLMKDMGYEVRKALIVYLGKDLQVVDASA